jgi:hypothetical protein
MITKWEYCARQRGDNLINFEPRYMVEGSSSIIDIITRGGVKTGVDAESQHPIKIQKAMLINSKYDPVQQKEFFRIALDMFRNMFGLLTPKFMEPVSKFTPHHLQITKDYFFWLESSGKSQKEVDIWFQLFFDILDEEKLIETLQNTIKMVLGDKGNLGEYIATNLL